MRIILLVVIVVGLIALVFMAAGAISWAANTKLDLAAGKGADARGEGEAAVLLAQATEIAANTNRQDEMAAIASEHQQIVNSQNETAYADSVAMWATWKSVGAYAGGGFVIVLSITGGYFLIHRAWLMNNRLKKAPMLASNGPLVVVALPGGGVVITNTDNGYHFSVGPNGTVAPVGPNDQVMISTALANAYRRALLAQGYSRPQAAKILGSLREIVEHRDSGLTTILPAVTE